MPNMRRLFRPMAAAAALLLVFAATWTVLDRTEDRPRWLTVETPDAAVFGRTFEVRVTLKGAVGPTRIYCSLQRANAAKKDWGFLAAAGPARPAAGGRSLTFVFDVPDRDRTAFVFPLIFLSPTGRWEDAERAATARYAPVVRDGARPAGPALRKRPVYPYPSPAQAARRERAASAARPPGRPSAWVHPAIGVLLAAAAALAAAVSRRSVPAPGRFGRKRAWLGLAVLCAASAAVEMTGLAGHVAAWGRRLAAAGGVYELRQPFQKAAMAALAAASLGLFLYFIKAVRRSGADRPLMWAAVGLAGYLAVSFAAVLSFHAVDVAGTIVWHGVSPVAAMRGAGAVVTMVASASALRRRPAGPAT
ncbi:MAG TPA: hypothetical protein P5119_13445 [Candidatus Aminicenantes bacterium]|nr:hypothetical protein [Candidatus Aminicenantes bacterium]HRY66330.1 hypothetical protein [Candidatus Aminicenantes bacterium]HRZ73223.1 hypothetical protein [Candidatus Aminicenantes bacterium]